MTGLTALQKALGVTLHDPSLLEQALVHTSYVNEHSGATTGHNERLEYLGDAVLGSIVAERLYRHSPELDEGRMTKLRSLLVCRDALTRAARSINLGDYLYLGKGEEASGGRSKPANLSRAMEAVIAAVFLDRGLDTTREIVLRLLDEEIRKVMARGAGADYKSRLQELMQSRQQPVPVYRVIAATGPDHKRQYTVAAMSGDTVLGKGSGGSKKKAESEAARLALEALNADFTP